MTNNDHDVQAAIQLYDRYAKPLETEHPGEYVAVSPDGRMIFGPTAIDVLTEAQSALGPGNTIFKVGQIAVGKWRLATA